MIESATVTIVILLSCMVGTFLAIVALLSRHKRDIREIQNGLINSIPAPVEPPPPPQVNVNLRPMEEAINALPNKVLHSIQSSINTKKGALGELIGYIKLEAKYDRIIPLGNIVDFMCIKFPLVGEDGYVDFVDIKTGKNARLSKEQRLLQQLIKDKKINFIKLKVNTQADDTSSE